MPPTVERVHVGQHAAQSAVIGELCYEVGGRHEEVGGRSEERLPVGRRSQVEEVGVVGNVQHGIHVPLQPFALMGKLPCQRLHKALTALRYGVRLPVLGEEEAVGAVIVHVKEPHTVDDT